MVQYKTSLVLPRTNVYLSLATIPAVLYVDRVGRKPVLTVGAIGSKSLGRRHPHT